MENDVGDGRTGKDVSEVGRNVSSLSSHRRTEVSIKIEGWDPKSVPHGYPCENRKHVRLELHVPSFVDTPVELVSLHLLISSYEEGKDWVHVSIHGV